MTTPPRRRWYRFSLRTFFVVLVVLAVPCAWMAREFSRVRERQAVWTWLDTKRGLIEWSPGDNNVWWVIPAHQPDAWYALLGETRTLSELRFPRTAESAESNEIDSVRRAFPEAQIEPWPD